VKLGLSEEQMKNDWKQQRCGLYAVQLVAYTVWDRGRRDEIRAQLSMRKMGKQIHERKKN
jgi:hypothetical protein